MIPKLTPPFVIIRITNKQGNLLKSIYCHLVGCGSICGTKDCESFRQQVLVTNFLYFNWKQKALFTNNVSIWKIIFGENYIYKKGILFPYKKCVTEKKHIRKNYFNRLYALSSNKPDDVCCHQSDPRAKGKKCLFFFYYWGKLERLDFRQRA